MLRIGHGRLGLLQARLPTPFHIEFESPNLNSLYDELRMGGIEPTAPPQEKEWGEMDFRAIDPDGNIVEFGAVRGDQPLRYAALNSGLLLDSGSRSCPGILARAAYPCTPGASFVRFANLPVAR